MAQQLNSKTLEALTAVRASGLVGIFECEECGCEMLAGSDQYDDDFGPMCINCDADKIGPYLDWLNERDETR